MECSEARRLIDAGVRPGSRERQRVELGFHLARCPDCRTYRAASGPALLEALLASPPAAPPVTPPPDQRRPAPPRPRLHRRPARPLWLRAVVGTLLLLGLLWLGSTAARLSYAAYVINQNVAAMRLSPTPILSIPRATQLPTAARPLSATPRASAMPAPRASVTPFASDAPPIDRPPLPRSTSVAQVAPPLPSAVRLPPVEGVVLPTLIPTAPVSGPAGAAVNILLLGSDRRPGESWTTRSDAIVVLRLEPRRQRVAMLSLPRDLIVSIPGYGQARINAATVYGDSDQSLDGGTELARRTVGALLGLPIHHVVRVDFNAFVHAIDAIGGVDIVVEQALYDPEYPTMDYGYMEAYFPAGPQHMDGETALMYSRIRHSDSGYARNRRQQQVILAALTQARQRDPLAQVELLADLTSALRDDIITDLTLDQMVGFAWTFRSIDPGAVERYALDETMVSEGLLADDPYATFPLPGAIDALVREFVR